MLSRSWQSVQLLQSWHLLKVNLKTYDIEVTAIIHRDTVAKLPRDFR